MAHLLATHQNLRNHGRLLVLILAVACIADVLMAGTQFLNDCRPFPGAQPALRNIVETLLALCVPPVCLLVFAYVRSAQLLQFQLLDTLQRNNQQIDELEQCIRTREQFLSVITHEIRTPLSGLTLSLQLLNDPRCKPERKAHYLRNMLVGSRSLMSLCSRILDLGKLRSGCFTLDTGVFEIKPLLESVICLFEGAAQQKGLRLYSEIEADLQEPLIGDSLRLQQMLSNLVGNALKFTQTGEIAIHVRRAEEAGMKAAASGIRLHFSVTDSGCGIPPMALEGLFKPYGQIGAAKGNAQFCELTSMNTGTGLGLWVVKELANRMGGSVGVQSNGETGSCFWFTALLKQPTACKNEQTSVQKTKISI